MENNNKIVKGVSNKYYMAKSFWGQVEELTIQAYEFKYEANLTRAEFIYEAIIDCVGDLIDRDDLCNLYSRFLDRENRQNLPSSDYSELELAVLQAVGESLGPEAKEVVLDWLFKL